MSSSHLQGDHLAATLLVACIMAAVAPGTSLAATSMSGGFGQEAITQAWQWIVASQRDLLLQMRHALSVIGDGDTSSGGLVLIALAFGYGVVHALGPGHGKVVITSYALANSDTVRRSIAISFMAALVQAGSAIVVVIAGLMILGHAARKILAFEGTLEMLSGALIALLGIYLIFGRLADHVRRRRAYRQAAPAAADRPTSPLAALSHGACHHAHCVEPKHVAGQWSWRNAWLLALSVGIRPCTGALLLLVFARSQGLLWAGLVGAFAMALGTASTVSALAMAAVGSREWAFRTMVKTPTWSIMLRDAVILLAGFALIWIGTAMALTPAPKSPF